MPMPDCACKVINGKTGYIRDNSSWIIGRVVRDFEKWKDDGKKNGPISTRVNEILGEVWSCEQKEAEKKMAGAGLPVQRCSQAGLCVSIYDAKKARKGYSGCDWIYWLGFGTIILQLGLAAIPCGIFGDWSILLITAVGNLLSLTTGLPSQWAREKWACRENATKITILTRGNGNQHAIVIRGQGRGFDLEDLGTGFINLEAFTSMSTRIYVGVHACFWILLLITAAGIKKNTWFLLAIGGLGMLQNIIVAGSWRDPKEFGMPLEFREVIGHRKVMEALYAVERKYHGVGKSMLATYFPGTLREDEIKKWEEFDQIAKTNDWSLENVKSNSLDNDTDTID